MNLAVDHTMMQQRIPGENKPLLEVLGLRTYFYIRGNIAKAVDDVDLQIHSGATLGLVGESGCGKSVTARSILRLIPNPPGRIVGGKIIYGDRNLLDLPEEEMLKIRGNHISMVFQEPMTSLNPVYTAGDQVAEVIRLHQGLSRKETREKVVEMFRLVGIPAPEKRINDYPHQMSGGMRQRVMIAMALACNPNLMIADEPTTALDVTIQAQILDLMNNLKKETGAAVLLITHDLGIVAEMAQTVAVMYAGKVMEYADVKSLFSDPTHPYTVGLMKSIPFIGKGDAKERLYTILGVVPPLTSLPSGCLFHNRCPEAMKECDTVEPKLVSLGDRHAVRCLRNQ
jgi:oligopeptide/dipeptide ABC transporter ATP-binding protein